MLICIDSSVIIPGIISRRSAAARVLDLIGPEFTLVIPRLIALEVTRNLKTPEQVRQFYKMFQGYVFALIVDEPVPRELVIKYTESGLPDKADAFIGGFAEWMKVQYLVSENRHFLRDLKTDVFQVLSAEEFMSHGEDIANQT